MPAGAAALGATAPLQKPQPPPPLGADRVMTFGFVRSARVVNASSPASSSCGFVGVGTRKPKSWALPEVNVARRMKYCVLDAASQMMMALSSAICTDWPACGATAQPAARSAGTRNSPAASDTAVKDKTV